MNMNRILALVLIYACAWTGWVTLGTVTQGRSEELSERLEYEVEKLWGSELVQKAPTLSVKIPGTEDLRWIMPEKNVITVSMETDNRRKMLKWYTTYIKT